MLSQLKQGHWPIFLLSSMSTVANLFLPIFLVRLLSPEDMGLYKIFFLYLSTLPFLFMTGGPLNSVYYWVGKPENERMDYLKSSWVLTLILSALIVAIGAPLAYAYTDTFQLSFEQIIILLIAGFLWCPSSFYMETTIAMGKTAKGSWFDAIYEFLKVGIFLFIAWKFKSLMGLFIAFTGIHLIKFIHGLHLGIKQRIISFSVSRDQMRQVLKYCLPVSLTASLGFVVDKVDLLILSNQLSILDFAFYSLGCLLIPPLILLEMSVQKILIPELSKCYEDKNWTGASKAYQKAIADISFLMIPSVFGLFFFALSAYAA